LIAAEALHDPGVYGAVALELHSSHRTVKDALKGYPARPALQRAIVAALVRAGVDVATIPVLAEAERAKRRAQLKPAPAACARCAILAAELAQAQAELAAMRARPKLVAVPTPAPETGHAAG
jgi:hypothetical protein